MDNKRAPACPPTIALDAADELLTIMIDLDQRTVARASLSALLNDASFLSQGDDSTRPTPHGLIERAASRRVVTDHRLSTSAGH